MSKRIDRIYYFDYTQKIGFYDSISDFTSVEMQYISMAVSTEKIRVNSTPTQFTIDVDLSTQIREYAISHMEQLVEISEQLAINSPQYIYICYADDTEKYYKYNEEFCNIFSMATSNVVIEEIPAPQVTSPYALQKDTSLDSTSYTGSTSTTTTSYVQPTINTKSSYSKKNDEVPWGKILIGAFLILVLSVISIYGITNSSETASTTHTTSDANAVREPTSGTILYGEPVYNGSEGSEITITTSSEEACMVKLKTAGGTTRLSFYVRAGDTVTVGVPREYLYVYFASGDTWYGTTKLFGEYTSYSKDNELRDFINHTWEYTLYPVTNGNFSETPIDASEF